MFSVDIFLLGATSGFSFEHDDFFLYLLLWNLSPDAEPFSHDPTSHTHSAPHYGDSPLAPRWLRQLNENGALTNSKIPLPGTLRKLCIVGEAQQITWESLHLMDSTVDRTFVTEGFSAAIFLRVSVAPKHFVICSLWIVLTTLCQARGSSSPLGSHCVKRCLAAEPCGF